MSPTPVHKSAQLRRSPLLLALLLALPAAPAAAQNPGGPPAGTAAGPFSIAAKPLAQALADWAAQSRLQFSVAPELLAGKVSPGVSGSLAPMQALDRLLTGSGLAAFVEGSTVVIRPASAEATLPAIRATAKALTQDSSLGHLARHNTSGALGNKAVLDTPFSVSVVDSQEMLERGARSIGQIFFRDPSVYTPTPSSSTDWWGTQIRGLGVRNHYVDDIPMLLHWGGDFPTEVVESVAALKGLTGFMYGFGEPGGALSYQLKRPTPTPETSLDIGYRNPRLLSVHLDTSRRLGDDTGLRINLATEQGTAYNAAEIDRKVASLALDKRFGASLDWRSTLVFEDGRTKGEPFQFYFSSYDVAGSGGRLPTPTYDYDKVNVDNAYYDTRTVLATTGVAWRIDERWTLRYQAGLSRKDHRSNKAFANLLNEAGDYSGQMYNFAGQLDTLFTQAMLQATLSAAGMKHELVGGLGLQRSKEKWGSDWYWSNDFNGNINVTQPFRVTRTPDFSLEPVSADTAQWYAFASDTVHIGEHLQAIAGLRFTDYDMKDMDGDPGVDSGYRVRKASPTLAVIFKPDAGTSVYASYVEGLEPGTRVGADYANVGELLGATVSKQQEVGIKHQSGATDLSAAIFRIQRANQMDDVRDGLRYLTQDGELVYEGVELSVARQLTRNLNLGVGAIYLDAVIAKVSSDNAAVEGNAPSNAPRWQIVGNTQYRVAAVDGLKLHGDVRYFGATYVSDDNRLAVPARTVVNAGLSYDFRARDRDWTLYANLNNVFNRKYWASGGWSSGNLGEARNLSLNLRAPF
ncbi:TonB-dependent receptor [Variovorax sp. YR752]|uniref:TonB-dependent siderophore receptor n=1 Tax=Variovorax sp. YR752 TaxID=1884383 RepID=UPI003137E35E